jgi:Leucine-rich repeat (LRR) protein
MKKTRIMLQDTEEWSFASTDEYVVYEINKEVYANVKQIAFLYTGVDDNNFEFEINKIRLPSLKTIHIHEDEKSLSDKFFSKVSSESLKQVENIGLSELNTHTHFPDWITHCVNMQTLNFSMIGLRDLPTIFGKFKELKNITCEGNSFAEIPEVIFNCTKLESLHFYSANKMTEVPDSVAKLRVLKEFSFCDASLKYVSPELFLLPKIESLNFSHSSLKNLDKSTMDAVRIFLNKKTHVSDQCFGQGGWLTEFLHQKHNL